MNKLEPKLPGFPKVDTSLLLNAVETEAKRLNAESHDDVVAEYAPKPVPEPATIKHADALVDHLAALLESDKARSEAVRDAIRRATVMEAEYRASWDEQMKIIEDALERIGKLRNTN